MPFDGENNSRGGGGDGRKRHINANIPQLTEEQAQEIHKVLLVASVQVEALGYGKPFGILAVMEQGSIVTGYHEDTCTGCFFGTIHDAALEIIGERPNRLGASFLEAMRKALMNRDEPPETPIDPR